MAEVNIFSSMDVKGILAHKKTGDTKTVKEHIIQAYGGDPTIPFIIDQALINKLKEKAANPPLFGWTDYKQIPDYTRLVSAKRSDARYPLTADDVDQGYLTTIYNLQIRVSKGDTIRWWGHSIDPKSSTQSIISNVNFHAHSSEFSPTLSTQSFYFASKLIGAAISNGLYVETSTTFALEGVIPSNWSGTYNYDVEIQLLSGTFVGATGLMSLPIAKLVVDPTIIVS